MDDFTTAYIKCSLWASNDESTPEGGKPMDETYTPEHISPEALVVMETDCKKFQAENAEDICKAKGGKDLALAGHLFWLNRNGHGCGFWDGGWEEEAGERLSKASEAFGECNLYVSDGLIYSF